MRGPCVAGLDFPPCCHLDFERVDLQQLCALLEVVAAALCLAGPATAAGWGTVDILHRSTLACLTNLSCLALAALMAANASSPSQAHRSDAHLWRSFRMRIARPYSFERNHRPQSFRLVLNHSRSLLPSFSASSVMA